MSGKPQPVLSRLLKKIKKDDNTGCWVFTGAIIISRGGKRKEGTHYGVIGIDYKHVLVHRYMYWEHYLKPQGILLDSKLCVCHTCDNTLCCNPEHLFLGTHKDNSMDASKKGRLQKGEKHTNNVLSEEQVLEIFKMKGTLKEIGEKFGIDARNVLGIKRRETWAWLTLNEKPIIENHSLKLSKEQVLEIYSMKGTHSEIAIKFNVSYRTIQSIRSGVNWAWLTKGVKFE